VAQVPWKTKRVLDESFGIRRKTYHDMSIFWKIKFALRNTSIYNSNFLMIPGVWGAFLAIKVETKYLHEQNDVQKYLEKTEASL